MNAVIITLARHYARQGVKDELKAQGKRVQDFEAKQITAWAFEWLDHHPELIDRAAKTVRNNSEH